MASLIVHVLRAPAGIHPASAVALCVARDLATERGATGTALAMGDLNGDGYTDVAIGAGEAAHDDTGQNIKVGTVHVVYGPLPTGERITVDEDVGQQLIIGNKDSGIGERLGSALARGDVTGGVFSFGQGECRSASWTAPALASLAAASRCSLERREVWGGMGRYGEIWGDKRCV